MLSNYKCSSAFRFEGSMGAGSGTYTFETDECIDLSLLNLPTFCRKNFCGN